MIKTVLVGAALAGLSAGAATLPMFGDKVYIFSPEDSIEEIDRQCEAKAKVAAEMASEVA